MTLILRSAWEPPEGPTSACSICGHRFLELTWYVETGEFMCGPCEIWADMNITYRDARYAWLEEDLSP